jgi:hypothetical protein
MVAYLLGNWNNTSDAGFGYSNGNNNSRTNTDNNIGFRPASQLRRRMLTGMRPN